MSDSSESADMTYSAYSVLYDHLPSKTRSEVETNADWLPEIRSSLEAGKTPNWYPGLPSYVKAIAFSMTVEASTTSTSHKSSSTRSSKEPSKTSTKKSSSTSHSSSHSSSKEVSSASHETPSTSNKPLGSPTSAFITSVPQGPTETALNPTKAALSTGAKAGVGVGVTAAVLIAGAGIAFFIFKKRRNSGASDVKDIDERVVTPRFGAMVHEDLPEYVSR